MDIRGIAKFSLVDFPGQMACILFTGNCNLRCPFCHNPHLVFDPESQPLIQEEDIFGFLAKRKGKLDGMVISGGEPCLQKDLVQFVDKVKKAGFLVRIDTNGTLPDIIAQCHRNAGIDALGVDYKTTADRYGEMSEDGTSYASAVKQTISSAVKNRIPLTVRTTVHKALLSPSDLSTIRMELDQLGVGQWILQQFHSVDTIGGSLESLPTYQDHELLEIARGLHDTKVQGLG